MNNGLREGIAMGSLQHQHPPGHSPFDVIRRIDDDGREFWSARDLMPHLGYEKWERFENAIGRARISCRLSGMEPEDHLPGAGKMVQVGSGVVRNFPDYHLSRHGCHLVAMTGDVRKRKIADAQAYFSARIYQAEQIEKAVADGRLSAPRPWSERVVATFEPHMLQMRLYHPDRFTVVTALVGEMLVMEDILTAHHFPLQPTDRPDVSIGSCWARYRRSLGLADADEHAPLFLREQGITVELAVYSNDERGIFDRWFAATYLPEKLPNYYDHKKEFRRHGKLPPASAADHTSLRLGGRPALLDHRVREQLTQAGGFVPAGGRHPALAFGQRQLFDRS